MDSRKEIYEAPKCECLEMENEGVLCASEAKMSSTFSVWEDEVQQAGSVSWPE